MYYNFQAEAKVMQKYLEDMQDKEWIHQSKLLIASLMLFMSKKDTTDLHLCVNYWALNSIIVKNCYPLPLINILLKQLRKAYYFTHLDL